jgi:hypothetical protein
MRLSSRREEDPCCARPLPLRLQWVSAPGLLCSNTASCRNPISKRSVLRTWAQVPTCCCRRSAAPPCLPSRPLTGKCHLSLPRHRCPSCLLCQALQPPRPLLRSPPLLRGRPPTATLLHAPRRGTPLSIETTRAADVVAPAPLFQSTSSLVADALTVALAVAKAAYAEATLLPASAAAALHADPFSAAAPDDDLTAALAAAHGARERAARATVAPLSAVLVTPPAAAGAAGHAMGVGASSAPPVDAAAPPPIGAAPLLTGGASFFCGLGMPPEDAPHAAAAFLRSTTPVVTNVCSGSAALYGAATTTTFPESHEGGEGHGGRRRRKGRHRHTSPLVVAGVP